MRPLIEILDEWAINSEFDSWKDFYKIADYYTVMFWFEQLSNQYAIEIAQDALNRADECNCVKQTKIVIGKQTFFP